MKSQVVDGLILIANSDSQFPLFMLGHNTMNDMEQHLVEFVYANATILQTTPTTQMPPKDEFFSTI